MRIWDDAKNFNFIERIWDNAKPTIEILISMGEYGMMLKSTIEILPWVGDPTMTFMVFNGLHSGNLLYPLMNFKAIYISLVYLYVHLLVIIFYKKIFIP